jgi:hypothetical protein
LTLRGAAHPATRTTTSVPHTPLVQRRRGALLRAAAAMSLLLGYADLARGGITLAPVLLVAAYGFLVPFAILEP